MSVNNVIDPSDLFRELNLDQALKPEDVDRLAEQLTSTTDNIRTLINRTHAQRAQAAERLDLAAAGGDELEDIAKQIADHAETLYQTWKARGLTPTEVLKSQNTATLNSEAAQTLSRQLRDGASRPSTPSRHSPTQAGFPRGQPALSGSHPSPTSPQALEHNVPIRLEHRSSNVMTNGSAVRPAVRQATPRPGDLVTSADTDKLSVRQSSRQATPRPSDEAMRPADGDKPAVRHATRQATPRPNVSPVDLLASPDGDRSLEELVKNFVQEDKARRGVPALSGRQQERGYQTLPAQQQQQQQQRQPYRGAKTAPGLLSTKLQVSTNGQTRVLQSSPDETATAAGTSTWPLKMRPSAQSQIHTPVPTSQSQIPAVQLQIHNPVPTSQSQIHTPVPASQPQIHIAQPQIHAPVPSAVPSELQLAADAALAEISEQEERLRTALQTGEVIRDERSRSRSRSPRPTDGLSTVDYAKQRFQDPQVRSRVAQRLEDTRALSLREASGAAVTEARHRYDNGQINITDSQWRSEWLPGRYAVDPDSGVLMPAESWRRKRALMKATADQPRTVSPLPHPELTEEQKQHIRERTLSPTPYNAAGVAIRPFLTQGSVAERVLIFEKCPIELKQRATQDLQEKKKQPALVAWRHQNEVRDKAQTYGREKEGRSSTESPTASPKSLPKRSSNSRSQKSSLIPKFHYPNGRPESREKMEAQIQRISQAFSSYPGGQVPKDKFAAIAKACEVPLYWKVPLFLAGGGEKNGYVTVNSFLDFWKRLVATCHDPASRFVRILTAGQRNHLVPEDLVPLVQDVVETHPGLNFLKEAVEFHSRYVHTVIARIFYCVNRSWSGRISVPELRRSNLLKTIQTLELEEDINQITDYFSYEHFYVIYCKFWELDKDHDLLIDKTDLARHNDHAVSSRIIERIFSGAVTRGSSRRQEKMTYTEFVWFLLSEEDKKHPTAIEYWFRCMDLDGDGLISMYELQYFYEEQLQRLEALGIEALPFEDCLCWMLDMVQPEIPGKIALSDLKRCQMANVFFDTFFNLEKYLEHDQRDPFAVQRDGEPGLQQMSDWERYAAEEYELLVAEEGAAEQDPEFMYDEDTDVGDSQALERLSVSEQCRPGRQEAVDDDYAETDADYTYISNSSAIPADQRTHHSKVV